MKTKLSLKEVFLLGITLFGMFFGAGNLIFPVHMGQLAGRNVPGATLGFIITGVTIPILAVAAIGITHSDGLEDLCRKKVGKGFGLLFTTLLYLTIGPLFAIPRCCTTTFTTGVSPLLGNGNEAVALLFFSAAFFLLVLLFSLRPNEIMTWVGKLITPLFLLLLFVIIISSLRNPGAAASTVEPHESYRTGYFFSGILEGYNTMDAIAGLAFGIIIVECIRSLGVKEDGRIAVEIAKAGLITAVLMGLIYFLTAIIGAQSRGLFEISENGGIALSQIAGHYLGKTGSVVLALTIGFACLKTAIGLVTSCSETFEKMTGGKVPYRTWVYVFTAFSFGISNVGLSRLIEYSVPMLMLLYPLAMVLILLCLVAGKTAKRSAFIGALTGALIAAVFDFLRTLPFGIDVSFAEKIFPFYNLGFAWVVPSLLGFCIGVFLFPEKKSR